MVSTVSCAPPGVRERVLTTVLSASNLDYGHTFSVDRDGALSWVCVKVLHNMGNEDVRIVERGVSAD